MSRGAMVLAAFTAACSPRAPAVDNPPAPTSDSAPSAAATVATAVTLERTPCFGTCPVYQVAIAPTGAVHYFGKHHVTRLGEATAEIPRAAVDSLLSALDAGGYFGFAERYVMDSPACGLYATDSPTVITSVTYGGRTKTIRHDYGCSAAPPDLAQLERMIDSVAGSSRWTGK